ncbi:MAG TPA: glycosyltransferase family 87 protein [Terriglobales bacterium]
MTWVRFGKRKEFAAGVFLLAMTFGNVISAARLAGFLRDGYQNFTIFYSAARMVRSGQSTVLYDLSAQYRAQQQFAPNVLIRRAALPYNHPPFEALLFLPFTFLPYVPAYLLWTLLNGMMVAASLMLLRRQFVEIGNLPLAFLALAATGFVPVVSGVVQGQDSVLLLFLFVIALTAMEKGKDAAAGAVLAAGLFKFNLVLPLVFLLAVRRWRLLLGFVPVAALLGGVSLAMVGVHGAVGYVQLLLRLENTGAGGSIVGSDMPNLRGIIASLAGGHSGASLMPLTIACSAATILIALWRMGPIRDSVRFPFLLATVTTILVSYHTLTYDLSLLLPAALLLFAAPGPESGRQSQADTVLLVLLYLTPLFEPFWPRVNQFCWPVLVLTWLFWKLGRGRTAESFAGP